MISATRRTHTGNRVHGTIRIRLNERRGEVALPNEIQEFGGLWPVDLGCNVLVDVGAARRIDTWNTALLAAALRAAAHIEIIGDHPIGVASITRALNMRLAYDRGRQE